MMRFTIVHKININLKTIYFILKYNIIINKKNIMLLKLFKMMNL